MRTVFPKNTGVVQWPEPGPQDGASEDYPSRAPNQLNSVGWYDDGQGGMCVYFVVETPKCDQNLTTASDQWHRCPAVICDHLIYHETHPLQEDFLAVLPVASSNWCWWHYDGAGIQYPFEARYENLTSEGKILYNFLAKMYHPHPVLICTHIDT